MPEGATDRTVFEGVKTTTRTVAMVKEARFLFRLRDGGMYPKIIQGGWRPTTEYSKDTHGKDALDFGTKTFALTRAKLWETCVWEVGFASWRRTYIAGLWSAHTHSLPKNGYLSDSAERQIVQWFQGDNALKSDKPYPGILSSGFVVRTWEKYLELRPHGHIALAATIEAFENGTPVDSNDVHQIQSALNHYLNSKLLVDGIPGPATRGVYKTYEARLYGGDIGDGLPGEDSLEQLGFTVTP